MPKANLKAPFVVIPVFMTKILSRFCKVVNFAYDTKADSVIREIAKLFYQLFFFFAKICKLQ